MKLYLFPPSTRVIAVVALKHSLSLDWDSVPVDLGRGDQRASSAVGGLIPSAEALALLLPQYPEIVRWYDGLASLLAWREALAARQAAVASWLVKN